MHAGMPCEPGRSTVVVVLIGSGLSQFSFLKLKCLPGSFALFCLCNDHIGRISCSLAGFWAAAPPTLAALLPGCHARVCVCVWGASSAVESVCVWGSTFDLCPLRVCERSVSCSGCAIDMTAPALPCMSTCCMRGAGSLPVLLTSLLSAPRTSFLRPRTEKPV